MKNALGLIETVGMAAAIEAADAAVKSANVSLIGVELTKGDGMVTVKIEGDVGAVKAAIDAASQAALKVNKVFATKVIARPAEGLDELVYSKETKGVIKPETSTEVAAEPIPVPVPEAAPVVEAVPVVEAAPIAQETLTPSPDASRPGHCNYCEDPACPRRKGDPRDWCIHHLE